ncbi:phage terminase large subunit [Gaoshiqia sediminis]|uniref:Phage terminase large subunit n=1 Tax=Gaoshiqia sediminis TaxID=2986998 RepID=A0AA42C7Y7_9BACT|nr:phage terminase large subunit [Gaoshiqia sediminis]MCW0484054.1 phage terminase large subunit [Gaoshiqia sediminis]
MNQVRTKRDVLLMQAEAAIILRKREARKDFWAFCMYMDPKFFSKRPFLKLIAMALMRIYYAYCSKTIRRLAVSLPPRAGKSYIMSLFIAWMFGHFPEESVMRNTCSSPLYNKLSYDTRDIVRSRRYNEIFTEISLKSDKQNVNGWNLSQSKQVGYFGAGVGGSVIGFGASMLAVTDDLYKSLEDALSDTNNEKVWSWKQGTHDSRIEGNCCSIDIGTRWSEKDVLGRLEEMGKYDEIIRIPALDENDESFCEDVHTTEYYRELRAETEESIWEAEYMQNPIEAKGLLFPKSELQRFKRDELKGSAGVIGACDVADEGDDDFCAPFGHVSGDKVYITDMLFTKDPVEITMPRLSQMIIDAGCDLMRIESNNGGRIFGLGVRDILKGQRHTKCEIQARHTSSNKETRILMKSGWIKKHCVFLDESEYEKGSDYARFIKALTSYKKEGGNAHDDAPDGMTILAQLYEAYLLQRQPRKVARGAGR